MSPLKRIFRHTRRFGAGTALQATRLYGSKKTMVPVHLPQLRHPLWARSGTSDVPTFEEVFVAREYDLPFSDFEPVQIIDLGANIGYASVYFSARWPGAKVLAVEPDGQNTAMLERNTRPWPGITRLQAAVWAHPARVAIANPADASNAFRMQEFPEDDGSSVTAFTVDQLIDSVGCDRLDLLKMDVEGAERDILQNADSWLSRVNVLVVELHDRIVPGCGEALCQALAGRRFRMEIVGANLAIDLR
jgi:FkbM family methyltransferase